jgi:ribonuclease HI
MTKYYAVKSGRKIGVYKTWAECQANTNGFSGAIFKSFATEQEALNFISASTTKIEKKQIDTDTDSESEEEEVKEVIEIYTDGSHQRDKGYLGLGAYCKYKEKEYSLSMTCDAELLASYGITETHCSNPTAEFLAFNCVLKIFQKAKLPSNIGLLFWIDYIGVQHWISGDWTAKEPYIIKIRNNCLSRMKRMQCPIEIRHVKAHSGVEGNEKADALAGNRENFSNFDKLIALLQK